MTAELTPPVRHDRFAALRFRDFRWLIAGRFVAQLGEMTIYVAITWELYQRTGDPLALALVGLVQILPVMVLSLPGGYAADRYNRRLITMFSQLLLVGCALMLAYLSVTQGPLVLIYATLAVIGIGRAFNNPAEAALTPQTVPPEYYYNSITWSSSVWQVSSIAGPALGGIITSLGGAPLVYVFNAFAGLVLIGVLTTLTVKQKNTPEQHEPPLQSLATGLRFLRRSRILLASITLDLFAVLLGGAVALLPIYASDILHVGAAGLGILRAAQSVGAVTMIAFLLWRPPFKHAGLVLLFAVAGFGVATIAFGVSTSFWFSVLMLALTGALDYISVVVRHTLFLIYTPDAMRGRVGAVNSVFIGASNELGGFESGVAAKLLGPVGAVVFGGIGTILVVAFVAWWSPELRNLGEMKAEEPA